MVTYYLERLVTMLASFDGDFFMGRIRNVIELYAMTSLSCCGARGACGGHLGGSLVTGVQSRNVIVADWITVDV